MGRHLILTVHGIGEQKPGETVDQVVGAATTWLDGNPRPPIEVERGMIELAESTFDGNPRNAELFEVNLRTVTDPAVPQDKALFAEVYWADRSPAPKGAIKTVLDLIWVVLALGYLAMDNVEQTHIRKGVASDQPNGRNTLAAQLVHLFTWIFFGAVATLNVFLLIGAAAVMTDRIPVSVFQNPALLFWLLFGLYAGGAIVGLGQSRSAPTYLRRVFWRGMLAMGTALTLCLVIGPLGLKLWACVPSDTGNCPPALEQFVAFQVFLLSIFWATLIFLTLILYALSAWTLQINDTLSEHRRLYPSICAGMLVFWMFFISGLWLTIEQLLETVSGLSGGQLQRLFESNLNESIETLSVAFVAIVLLGFVGVGLFAGRKTYKANLHTRSGLISRAIVNRLAQWVFLFGTIVLVLVTIREIAANQSFEAACNVGIGETNPISWALDRLACSQGEIGLIVLGATALMYRFSDFVSAGLGVARDIVTYAIRDKCYLGKDLETRQRNYPDRKAIDERFYRTLYYVLDIFPADHITVISHSQGTVIATQMLADPRVQRRIGGRTLTLITMGSPVTHIYQRYFPEMFTITASQLNASWFNIFRQDDFVGTEIEGGLIFANRNIPVDPGGHTGYFTDYQVWKALSDPAIGFDLFNPTPQPVQT
ncbi:hypothetical protein [Ruegeria sp. HKCCD6604]|uniref:hypothetical protein n=1 Tax=Ruegeria sp. HKCCD6604 TaxID=2683000 RepID=UPI001491A821|nr:hypothetical protein [Ruegeria sp. HKCCD6604]NOC93201.1 hypothetical protein [Ruegeria sp. HKCCD6604]